MVSSRALDRPIIPIAIVLVVATAHALWAHLRAVRAPRVMLFIDLETTIFLPYRRSAVTRRDPSSIGLGLWICRQLAVAMGGSLAYRRSDGETQFALSVPVAASPASAAALPNRSRRHGRPRPTRRACVTCRFSTIYARPTGGYINQSVDNDGGMSYVQPDG